MSERDYIKHIRRSLRSENQHPEAWVAWCGYYIGPAFAFTGLDHAAANQLNKGRLRPCRRCVAAGVKALQFDAYE